MLKKLGKRIIQNQRACEYKEGESCLQHCHRCIAPTEYTDIRYSVTSMYLCKTCFDRWIKRALEQTRLYLVVREISKLENAILALSLQEVDAERTQCDENLRNFY